MTSRNSQNHRIFKYRLAMFISLVVLIPVGYAVRFYGVGPERLNDWLGAIAYEIFWILLVPLFFPKVSPVWTAVGVCLVTCVLEFLQLWQPPWLQAIRATFVGRLVLGNTFTWLDFPAYFVGSFLGWLWMRSLLRVRSSV